LWSHPAWKGKFYRLSRLECLHLVEPRWNDWQEENNLPEQGVDLLITEEGLDCSASWAELQEKNNEKPGCFWRCCLT
jgi:hypothetical protein